MIKKKYRNKIQLLTETDSLIYEDCNDYFYQDMSAMKDEYDLAIYPKSSLFNDQIKNKVVAKFKYEASGQSLNEFVGLNPKMKWYQTHIDTRHDEAASLSKKR